MKRVIPQQHDLKSFSRARLVMSDNGCVHAQSSGQMFGWIEPLFSPSTSWTHIPHLSKHHIIKLRRLSFRHLHRFLPSEFSLTALLAWRSDQSTKLPVRYCLPCFQFAIPYRTLCDFSFGTQESLLFRQTSSKYRSSTPLSFVFMQRWEMISRAPTDPSSNTLASSAIIKVENVMPSISKYTLAEFFSSAGTVVDIRPFTARQSEFCQYLVTFTDRRMSQYALDTLNGTSLFGCNVKLEIFGGRHENSFGTQPTCFQRTRRPSSLDLTSTSFADRIPFAGRNIQTASEHVPPRARPQGDFAPHNTRISHRSSHHHVHRSNPSDPGNCNLYILNLSLDMTNENLRFIVQEHGELKHVCVLATLDNAGRRRAFVDMATPEEARAVMQALDGRRVHGYELHVSFAFVQRSGGPALNFNPRPASCAIEQARKLAKSPIQTHVAPKIAQEGSDEFTSATRSGPPSSIGSSYPKPSLYALDSNLKSCPTHAKAIAKQLLSISLPSPSESVYSGSTGLAENSVQSPASVSGRTSGSSESQTPVTSSFSSEILVYNVSPVACIDSDDLLKYLINQGFTRIKSVNLHMDQESGMSLGSGIIDFEGTQAASEAYRKLSSKALILDAMVIKCERGLMPVPLAAPQINPYSNFSHPNFMAQLKNVGGIPGLFPNPQLPGEVTSASPAILKLQCPNMNPVDWKA
ncbi:hypothetical protein CROQUDRAFT_672224 [Cronartium quercuum f. sp. fusiforme G11]|uniref:RRM domain-containing protein n=1 Tax=Cronartium quercuum f. sp. fusiforme G11 TaxID=708437 RepID=A0A9P6NDB7_9BASI|nr:hypothetical protein CROQUDRAFT_672224 [Cronartium quercuum f. sp. fusiforme G11]